MAYGPLEAAILEDPDDPERWAVYGDWLIERGDPRGQIIAIEAEMLRSGDTPARRARIEAIVDRHCRDWIGPALAEAMKVERGGQLFRIEIEHGFLTGARIGIERAWSGPEPEGLLEGLLSLPAARFLRRLTLGLFSADGDNRYPDAIAVLARAERPALRELTVGDPEDEPQISWVEVGRIDPLWRCLPALRALNVRGAGIEIDALRHDRIEQLALRTGGLPAATARAVAAGRAPSLDRLEVWFGSPSYGCDASVADLEPLWSGEGYPQLRHLGLQNAPFADEIAFALASVRAPWIERLRTLDLSMGTLTDAGALALAGAAERLGGLEGLCVGQNYVGPDGLAALRGAFGEALDAGYQQSATIDAGVRRYYVSVGE